jgi:hypothetical protein
MRTFKPRWASFYVAVGSNDDVIDSHEHFAEGGWYLENVALRDAAT